MEFNFALTKGRFCWMKREDVLKLYKINQEIENLKNYNDRKFLKDNEKDKIMKNITELKRMKDEIFFKDKMEKLLNDSENKIIKH